MTTGKGTSKRGYTVEPSFTGEKPMEPILIFGKST